jgi:hypothetical protein
LPDKGKLLDKDSTLDEGSKKGNDSTGGDSSTKDWKEIDAKKAAELILKNAYKDSELEKQINQLSKEAKEQLLQKLEEMHVPRELALAVAGAGALLAGQKLGGSFKVDAINATLNVDVQLKNGTEPSVNMSLKWEL